MESTTSLSDEQLRVLQERALQEVFTGRAATVYAEQFETDGRKRSRVIREAVESGFIEPSDSKTYRVLPRVLDTIETAQTDLFQTWQVNFEKNQASSAYEKPWIRLASLPMPIQKGVLLSNAVDWYVVSLTPYNYHVSFADEPEQPVDSTRSMSRYSTYWAGPFDTLDAARERLRSVDGTCLAVSSPILRGKAKAFHNERKFVRQFVINLLWGLAKLGIVPKDELFSSDDKARIDSQLEEGHPLHFGSRHSPETTSEVAWEANLKESIQRITDQISEQQHRLALLVHIRDAMDSYGGWEKFKRDYAAALRRELGITV